MKSEIASGSIDGQPCFFSDRQQENVLRGGGRVALDPHAGGDTARPVAGLARRRHWSQATLWLAFSLGWLLTFHVTGLAQAPSQATGAPDAQQIIETSTHHFQRAEEAWRAGQLEKARRDYDRALDLILESGIDVRTHPPLRRHYLDLVERIYQRQLALPSGEAGGAGRGFGQQVFTASPLDELTRLDLTPEELAAPSTEQTRTAVQSVSLDFSFQPNSLIQGFLNYYMGRGRATMENGLRRSGRFLEMAQRIFREEGVPQDLVWLGQVESAWSPMARSWAAAVGLWQFISGTAARYGLYQDAYIDERCSFEKATRASARYLKFLGDRYNGNWELAMAAYIAERTASTVRSIAWGRRTSGSSTPVVSSRGRRAIMFPIFWRRS